MNFLQLPLLVGIIAAFIDMGKQFGVTVSIDAGMYAQNLMLHRSPSVYTVVPWEAWVIIRIW